MNVCIFVFALLVGSAVGADGNPVCTTVLKNAGASPQFATLVGHAVHSLTVDDLRKFEPTVTEANKVPTINEYAKLSSDVLHRNARKKSEVSNGDRFMTEGFNTLDLVLRNMDSRKGLDWTTLEDVAHTFHMQEMWARLVPVYQKIKANPPADVVGACKCAMDVENNGILQTLRVAALKWREPGLMRLPKTNNQPAPSCQLRFLELGGMTHYGLQLDDMIGNEQGECGSAAWEKFKMHLNSYDAAHYYDPAFFLFCALNHAD